MSAEKVECGSTFFADATVSYVFSRISYVFMHVKPVKFMRVIAYVT